MPILPFKLNQDCRHHIPRQRHKVTNWPTYDASLRQRGSVTVWFTDEAIAAWAAAPRTTRGGQAWYSPLAILTALTIRAVFRLAYRQAEGLIGSVIGLLGLSLRVPDHTTLSRRAATLDVPRPRSAGADSELIHLLIPDPCPTLAQVLAFVSAYNFAKHLKALRWKTPFEAIWHAWTTMPEIFKLNPRHLIPGPNT